MTTSEAPSPVKPSFLICFAVKEEAAEFRKRMKNLFPRVEVLVTGMGKANAEREIIHALSQRKPSLVFTCGFAGGLDPNLKIGDVIFDADEVTELNRTFQSVGALSATFHCSDRVAVTVSEKSALRQATGADAVEMESSIIRRICRERGVASATVRVISDTALEDLPLDFNSLLDSNQNLSLARLAVTVLKNPGKIPRLMQLQRNTAFAARRLADVLEAVLLLPESRKV